MILIDSNVIVAALVGNHPHNKAALGLLGLDPLPPMMVAAHSYAEAFVTLTRRSGPGAYGIDATRVRNLLYDLQRSTKMVAMTAEQTIDSIRRFADIGIGARLYDYLIGRTGVLYGATAIVTFNTGHMRALFPQVAVQTPGEWLADNPSAG